MKPIQTPDKMQDCARRLAKIRGIQEEVALEMIATHYGYPSWNYFVRMYAYKQSILAEFPLLKKNKNALLKKLARLHVSHELLLDDAEKYSTQPLWTVEKKVCLLWKIEQYRSDHAAIKENVRNLNICNKLALFSNIEIIAITPQSILGILEVRLRTDAHVKRALNENCPSTSSTKTVRNTPSQSRMVTPFNDRDDIEYMSIGHMKFKIQK